MNNFERIKTMSIDEMTEFILTYAPIEDDNLWEFRIKFFKEWLKAESEG